MEMAIGPVKQRSTMHDDHHDLECIHRREPISEMANGIGDDGSGDQQFIIIGEAALTGDVRC
jgi:hypothetical protein